MMILAQDRLEVIAAWLAASSGPRRAPMGGDTLIGPFGIIVPSDFTEPPMLGFAEGALPIYVPTEQCEGVDTGPIITATPASQDRLWARLQSVVWRVEEGTLPPAVLIAITDPAQPLEAAVSAAGASGSDLAAFPLLALPIYALAPAHRAEIGHRLPMLR